MKWLEPGAWWMAAWMMPAILLLYLLKRKHEDRTVSSTLLWNRMLERMEANRPWQRLRQNLLLWLQLAAAALMILGLARPAVGTEGLSAGHTVLVADASGSMLAREEGDTRLDLAKETMKRWIRNADAGQKVTLIEAGRTPRVLAAGCRGDDCLEAVERIRGVSGSADLEGALSLARAIAGKEASAEVVLVGDGTGLEPDSRWLPDRFHRIGTRGGNVAVGAFSVKGDGRQAEAFARIDNPGGLPLQGSVFLKNAEGRILDVRTVSLRAGDSAVVRWNRLPHSPWYQVRVSAQGDVLPQDDAGWAMSAGAEKITVWMAGRENLFLRKALQLSGTLELVEADRLPDETGGPSMLAADGHSGPLPPRIPLLLFDPSPSWGLVQIAGLRPVSGEVSADPRHPVTAGLNMGDLHAAAAKVVKAPDWAKPVVSAGGIPLVLAGEHQGRRVVLFTFDPAKSDLPLRPEFPVLIYQAVRWLIPVAGQGGIQAEAGEPLQLPKADAAGTFRFQGEDPAGNQAVSTDRLPEQPGLYRMSDASSGALLGLVAVSFPDEESAVVPRDVPAAAGGHVKEAAGGLREWWRWLALAALLLAGAEWVVFSRGHSV